MVSVPAPTRAACRLRQQIEFEKSTRSAELWREIVRARIRTQARVLRGFGQNGALNLERMVQRVEPGDARNHEAQAARQYWKVLLPDGIKRVKEGATDAVNSRLNYGYAVMRSLVARALVASGLQPLIGIGHHSDANPLNLADDFLEPYRFVVEQHVLEILRNGADAPFDAQARKAVAACVGRDVTLKGETHRLPAAVERTVESYTRVLDAGLRGGVSLDLPEAIA
jgi:CRISPR-associated protein Cas1